MEVDLLKQKKLIKNINIHFEGLLKMLQRYYSHHDWDEKYYHSRSSLSGVTTSVSKTQLSLYKLLLDEIFPGDDVLVNHKHPLMFFDHAQRYPVELDIFIPKYDLAFEYQGTITRLFRTTNLRICYDI